MNVRIEFPGGGIPPHRKLSLQAASLRAVSLQAATLPTVPLLSTSLQAVSLKAVSLLSTSLQAVSLQAATLLTVSLVLCALFGSAGCSDPTSQLTGDETRVLIVGRRSDPVSERIALHYATARNVAPTHLLLLGLARSEEISRSTFESDLVEPLARWWRDTPAGNRPDYIVLTKGIPHRIYGSGDLTGTRASVDSELCDLPSMAKGLAPPIEGRRRNPYGRSGNEAFPPFSHETYGICLVTRLDGFDEADAIALVDRALAAESDLGGQSSASGARTSSPMASDTRPRPLFLFDLTGSPGPGNDWLRFAGERLLGSLDPKRYRVEVDTTGAFVTDRTDLLGYAGWGSNDPRYERDLRFSWLPGALATTFVSSSARTFQNPPPGWHPGRAAETKPFGGSTQSLVPDWVRSGATGAAGNAFEPYLDACVRPQVLFPAYLAGRTLAESFYLALPYLSWQSVILGDPLCAPFARTPEISD